MREQENVSNRPIDGILCVKGRNNRAGHLDDALTNKIIKIGSRLAEALKRSKKQTRRLK